MNQKTVNHILSAFSLSLLLFLAFGSTESDSDKGSSKTVSSLTALDKMVVAFEGEYTKNQIKVRIDKAMQLYGLSLTEENYSRAASTLIVLRKEYSVQEMAILDHMIRSYVPSVKISFPEQAAFSVVILK